MEFNNTITTLNKIGELIRDTYKGKLKAGGHIATGKLYNSINYKLVVTDNDIKLFFLAEDYYIHIEEGRRAGAKMPPVQAIQKWMIVKGIKDIKDNGKISYLISRSISRKGIKPSPFLREIKSTLKNYRIEIEEALNKDLKEEIKEIVNKNKTNK